VEHTISFFSVYTKEFLQKNSDYTILNNVWKLLNERAFLGMRKCIWVHCWANIWRIPEKLDSTDGNCQRTANNHILTNLFQMYSTQNCAFCNFTYRRLRHMTCSI